jgi:hypothetical protein
VIFAAGTAAALAALTASRRVSPAR